MTDAHGARPLLARFFPGIALVWLAAPASSASVRFEDVTDAAGIDFRHETGFDGRYLFPEIVTGGCAIFDADGDGSEDLFFVNGGALDPPRETSHALFRNRGDGTFADVSSPASLTTRAYGQGCAVADFDADGDLDLYVTAVGPNQLYRNDGGGAFVDVAGPSGVAAPDWSTSAAFGDLDGDGDLDLFVANYCLWSLAAQVPCRSTAGEADYCNPSAFEPAPDLYFRNRGDGTFENATRDAGFTHAYGHGLGVLVADLDEDGDSDVYVANDGDANSVWLNDGTGMFVDEGLLSGAAFDAAGTPEASMGIASADLDGDGDWELFVSHMTGETNTLYESDGGGVFDDATVSWGLSAASRPFTGFGTGFFDADLDTDADLFIANGAVIKDGAPQRDAWPYAQRNLFFENEGGRFRELLPEKAPWLAERAVSRGAAFGDVDGDGDVDVVLGNAGGTPQILRNDSERVSLHWLGITLRQDGLNREGIGARVAVPDEGGAARRVGRGGSFASASTARLTFALGSGSPVRVAVRWPDGFDEAFSISEVDRTVVLVRGGGRSEAFAASVPADRPEPDGVAPPEARPEPVPDGEIPPLPALDQVDPAVARRVGEARAAVKKSPDDARAWKSYGVALYADASAEERAAIVLRRAFALDPNDVRVAYLLALLAESRGDVASMEEHLNVTLELAPDYRPARMKRARLDADVGRLEDSRRRLNQLTAENPNDPFAWAELARVHRLAGDLDDARTAARRAVDVAPQARTAHYELALVERAVGSADSARAHFEAARALPESTAPDPWLEELHRGRGGDHALLTEATKARRSGALPRAHELITEYVVRRPDDAIGWANLAAVSRDLGRPEEALEAAERSVELDANRAESWALRGALLEATGDREGALVSLTRAVEVRPTLAPAWFDLGTLQKDEKRWAGAEASFARFVALRPDDAMGFLLRAEVRLARGRFEAAAEDLAQALEIDPNNARAHYRSGGLALKGSDPSRAAAHFAEATRLRPGWPDAHFGLGLALRAAGAPTEAQAAARRALELDPESERFRTLVSELEASGGP